jgi:pimeloyl-ACP methyl ester carboxylesterase
VPDPGSGGLPDDGPHLIEVTGGRKLAYAEYGAKDGRAVLYFHGFPSSRREARLLHEAAVATGARIIAPDRPGYGASDHDPNRTMADWAEDCAVLAERLGLEHFCILGVSGGGPYALSCARYLPERLPDSITGCTLVCPLGAIYIDALLDLMNPAARASLSVGQQPGWVQGLVYGSPTTAMLTHWPSLVEQFRHIGAPAPDQAVLGEGDTAHILNLTIADAMANGAPGARRDLQLYTSDWGIDFAAIDLPIRIWHGTADGTVPIDHARWYAEHLPKAQLTELPGEGHYSVPIRYARRILDDLIGTHPHG